MLVASALVALFLAAGPEAAASPAEPAPEAKPAKPPKPKMICTETAGLSRVKSRVCVPVKEAAKPAEAVEAKPAAPAAAE